MAEKQVMTLRVNSHTLEMGGEVLAIRQITRLSTYVDDGKKGFNQLRSIIVLAGMLAIIVGWSSSSAVLAVGGVLATAAAVFYSMIGTKRYILTIELSSGRKIALTSAHEAAVDDLRNTLGQIIESPSTQPSTIQLGGVYMVDARGGSGMQFGPNNTQNN